MILDDNSLARRFTFTIKGSKSPVLVQRFTAEERISECFNVQLWLVSEKQILPTDVIQREGLFSLEGSRCFHGMINRFSLTGRRGRFYLYRASLVPSVWFLSLNSDCRIFQEKSVIDIVTELLTSRMPNQRHEFRLFHKYEKRRYCTQFGESDWGFISRLFEEEGIFYFFDHYEDKDVLIIGDHTVAYASAVDQPLISCQTGDGLLADGEVATTFVLSRTVRPGKVTHTNYTFRRPSLDLTVQQKKETNLELEVYEYPGNYVHPERGRRLAKVRLEEKKTLEEVAEGTSNCQRFIPGHTFSLTGHDFDSLNKNYLLVTVLHSGSQSHVVGEQSGIGGDSCYSNQFLAIPEEVTVRPERTYGKPFIGGLQSAVVVGPRGEEIYADEYGRVKVQFYWDREGQRTDKSSCWLRISQPWSGQSWGMISIPRVGDEVLVDFINGDPDRPIVVGSVNNAQSPALYPLPDHKTRSGIRTRSYPNGGRDNYHELRFEDKKGSEEIYLQSERDWNILVKNDKAQTIGNDDILLVKNDRKKTVQMNQTQTVGINNTLDIGADQHERIGANKSETVGGNSAESVGAAKELSVGGLYQVTVGGIMNETVAGAKTEEVGLAKAVIVGADMAEQVAGSRKVTVGSTFEITAGESFQIRCGDSTFRMDSDGSLFINGSRVELAAAGVVKVTGEDIQLN